MKGVHPFYIILIDICSFLLKQSNLSVSDEPLSTGVSLVLTYALIKILFVPKQIINYEGSAE